MRITLLAAAVAAARPRPTALGPLYAAAAAT